jgi:hypothetical protein
LLLAFVSMFSQLVWCDMACNPGCNVIPWTPDVTAIGQAVG